GRKKVKRPSRRARNACRNGEWRLAQSVVVPGRFGGALLKHETNAAGLLRPRVTTAGVPMLFLQRLNARAGQRGEVAIRKTRQMVLVGLDRLDVFDAFPVHLGAGAVVGRRGDRRYAWL